MLEMKIQCESCGKSLPPDSSEALICSYECTWCQSCAEEKLNHICPKCKGELQQRPRRKATTN